jgi:hypothetical protein
MKMKIRTIGCVIVLLSNILMAQNLTPLEKSNFTKLTSHAELMTYLHEVVKDSKIMSIDSLTKSVEGRTVPFIKISKDNFSSKGKKLKVLIFAQQHGNEHSGKEGALFLMKEFSLNKLDYLLDRLDILLVPQMNPDGSEKNKRMSGSDLDMNRNHQILTAPEVLGLHQLFNKYLPEATIDVHEYSPFGKEWAQYGFRRDWDETVGTVTNPNLSNAIKKFEKEKYIPFIRNYLNKKGFSFHEYVVGGPPAIDRMRFSTVWINDGRQSFGSLSTFSFIQEGKNGRDSLDNIKYRAKGQMTALLGFLNFIYENSSHINKLVNTERQKLAESREGEKVIVRMEHIGDGKDERMKMLSTSTGKDTIVAVKNFHPVIKSLYEVERPKGYLVPKSDDKLIAWVNNHKIKFSDAKDISGSKFIIQKVDSAKTEILEEDDITVPALTQKEVQNVDLDKYIFIPTKQIYSNFLVLSLEPSSMFGLAQLNKYFKYLLQSGKDFSVLKVISSSKK